MKTATFLAIFFFLFLTTSTSFAGWGYSGKRDLKFNYKVEGEIEIKPDKAIFPIIITTHGNSYIDSLNTTRNITNEITDELKKLDNTIFTSSPSDFFKPRGAVKFSF